MDTSTDPTDITTNAKAGSKKPQTLASIVEYLRGFETGFVRTATQSELISYEEPYVHTGLPVYKVIKVFLTKDHQASEDPIFMVFVDNGAIHYCHGDCLDDYVLDEPEFFLDDTYNFEAIFSAFFLDGDTDLASFAGFFYLQD